jgi:spore cortex biosynthesis protein YabQ
MYAILAGILTGAMFDLYRIIRGSNVNKVIIAIEDILFWILAAMIVFAFLLYTNYAFLGAYVYIFMILSLALYIRFISDICVKFELKLVNILAKVFRVIFKHLIYPFKVIFHNIIGKNN